MALSRYSRVLRRARWAAAAAPASSSDATATAVLTPGASTSTSLPRDPFPVPARSVSSCPSPGGGRGLFDEDVGQPTHETHPELLSRGELAPGVSAAEVASRRDSLGERIAAIASSSNRSFHFGFGARSGVSTSNKSGSGGGPALAVLPSPLPTLMSGVIPYPYRPEADFYYLTGVSQPGCVAVVVAEEGDEDGESEGEDDGGRRRRRRRRRRHRFVLFVPDEDQRSVLWDGTRLSPGAARGVFGADEAYRMSELHSRLGPLLSSASVVFFDEDRAPSADPRYSSLMREALDRRRGAADDGGGDGGDVTSRSLPRRRRPSVFLPLRPQVHTLRWVKSDAELSLMRRSAEMASAGMRAAMRASLLGRGGGGRGGGEERTTTERRLASAFEHACKSLGADRLAYPPVVAGNSRACTIHYSRNDGVLRGGDWVLMDAGCEYFGYCSDVSRAWPVVDSNSSESASSLFSSGGPHADVHAALLEVHAKCVAAAVPGGTLSEIHALSVSLLAEAAARLAGRSPVPALSGLSASEIAGRGGRQGPLVRSGLYPHAVGHWLGLDTHDAPLGHGGAGGAGQPLVRNVVLTIEPGLYFPPDPSRWGRLAGVGMRLEDDVAVAGDGGSPEVLSAGAPLMPADVAAAVDGS